MEKEVVLTSPAHPRNESGAVGRLLNPVSLNFTGSAGYLEPLFRDGYFEKNIGHLRYCHLYTLVFYVLAGFIDYLLFPENLYALFSIRFKVVAPIFLLGYGFTFSPWYRHCWQQISVLYILLTGGSFMAFILIAQAPNAYEYYVGVLFCMMFGYTFIRERFVYASVAGFLLVVTYGVVSAGIVKMPAHILFQSNFYLILANLLGMLIARHLEVSARRDFFLEHRLSREQEKVLALNDVLEQRVKERTFDLAQSNEMLRRNIDDLRKSELERSKLEAQLRQAYKMEAIGTLAGGIAHDFNNILSAVMGYTELSLGRAEKGSAIENYLQEVHIAALRARDLVNQILAFARQAEEALKPIQVTPIAKEVVKLLRSSIPSSIEIRQRFKSDAYILGDPINIHQVLMNLATNATHAMEEGGILEIGTLDVAIAEGAFPGEKALKPGDYLKIWVSDTGSGIDPEIINSIFEPYFTTKGPGEGTGMGLAMVYGIVKKYSGEITVESQPTEVVLDRQDGGC